MTNSRFPLWKASLLVLASSALLPGQAFVEYGLATAASGVAAPAQRANKSIGGVFSNLTKTLDAAKETTGPVPAIPALAPAVAPARTAAVAPASSAAPAAPELADPATPAAPAVVYEDPAGIREGMDRPELLRRFGQPAMQITTGAGTESLTYAAKDRSVEVEMRDGKVDYVVTRKKPAAQSAVVRL